MARNTVDIIGDEALCASLIDRTITELVDSEVLGIGDFGFAGCNKLATVDLPAATSIGLSAFSGCSAITEVRFQSVRTVGQSAFEWLTRITTVDLHAATDINRYAFGDCDALKTLILRRAGVCRLDNTSAINGTPIARGTGYIYVPRALLSDTDSTKDYRRASNWSTYAARFRALEDYTVDGTVTGDLDPTKI